LHDAQATGIKQNSPRSVYPWSVGIPLKKAARGVCMIMLAPDRLKARLCEDVTP